MRFRFSLVFLLALFACVPRTVTPPKTQLQLREMQTRNYSVRSAKIAMKAVISTLLDEGFIIKSADRELGFISASKELNVEDTNEALVAQILGGANARYKKNTTIDAAATISEFGNETRVRLVFQTKTIDNFGSPLDATQIDNPQYYRDFFSKLDKSLYIEKEGL